MTYILKTMDGNSFRITEQEYKAAIMGDGLLVFSSCGVTVNKSRIEAIYPESKADEIEKRKNLQVGVLHDGTKVRRHFGQWVDATLQVPDEKGNYVPVRLDETYYPEIARDRVFSEEEFEKIRLLPTERRKTIMLEGTQEPRQLSEPISISKLLIK